MGSNVSLQLLRAITCRELTETKALWRKAEARDEERLHDLYVRIQPCLMPVLTLGFLLLSQLNPFFFFDQYELGFSYLRLK